MNPLNLFGFHRRPRRMRVVKLRVESDGMAVKFSLLMGHLQGEITCVPDDARLVAAGLLEAADAADRYAERLVG